MKSDARGGRRPGAGRPRQPAAPSAPGARIPGLRPKHARFVQEYLVDLNGTRAAIRAGYAEAHANVIASHLLTIVNIRTAVAEALVERQRRCDVSADRVLLELARIAYADIRDLFDPDGRVKSPTALDPAIVPAVASLEVVTRRLDAGAVEVVHKIKLAPKVEALKVLAQHLHLLKTTLDVAASVPITIVHRQLADDPPE